MVAKLALDDFFTKVGTPLGNCTAYFYFEKAAWSSWPSGASGIWCLPESQGNVAAGTTSPAVHDNHT